MSFVSLVVKEILGNNQKVSNSYENDCRFRLRLNSDPYSEHSQTSKMEHFSKIVNRFEVSPKAPFRMFDWVLDTSPKLSVSYYSLTPNHCVKSVQIWSVFWSVFVCIRTRKDSVFGHFLRSELLNFYLRFFKSTLPK